jgi:hypothetical protein
VDDDGWVGRGRLICVSSSRRAASAMLWAGFHGPSRGLEMRARYGNFLYFLLILQKYTTV